MNTETEFLKLFVDNVVDAVKGCPVVKGQETCISDNGHLNRQDLNFDRMVKLRLSRFLRWMVNLAMYWDNAEQFEAFWNELGRIILLASDIGDAINQEHAHADHWKKRQVKQRRKAFFDSQKKQ